MKKTEQKSMFARLFKQKNAPQTTGQIAQGLYEAALIQTRKPEFYTECGVPDSFDGRFDLLLVNIFILLRHMKDHLEYEEISQALFDATFKNMDQTLYTHRVIQRTRRDFCIHVSTQLHHSFS